MRHLSASEAHRDLEAVALVEELLAVFQLGVEVVRVDAGGHAYLLDLDNALILLGFLLLLGLLKAELAVVHNLADRGIGARSDLDQIEVMLGGDLQSFLCGHDTELFALSTYQAHFLVKYLFVDLMSSVCDC